MYGQCKDISTLKMRLIVLEQQRFEKFSFFSDHPVKSASEARNKRRTTPRVQHHEIYQNIDIRRAFCCGIRSGGEARVQPIRRLMLIFCLLALQRSIWLLNVAAEEYFDVETVLIIDRYMPFEKNKQKHCFENFD